MKKNRTFYVLKCLACYLKPFGWLLAGSLFLALLTVAATLYLPIQTGAVVDLLLGAGQVDFAALMPFLWQMALVAALGALSQWLMNRCNNRITFGVVQSLRNAAAEKLERLPISYLDQHPHGELLSRIMVDAEQVADGLFLGFTQIFTGVLTIFGTLIFMFSVHVGIALSVVILTPLSLFVASFIAKRTHSRFLAQSKARGEQSAFLNETVTNQKLVKTFGQEEKMQEKFDVLNDVLTRESIGAIFFSSITNPSTRFVNGLVYGVVATAGAFFVLGGGLTVGGLTCFLSYATQYTKPFNEISGVITELQNALAGAGRLLELLEEEEEENVERSAADGRTAECEEEPKIRGLVELKNVSFSYSPEEPLLKNINLTVQPGQKIAIVGPTGCGKTTLINLLLRFYDVDEGQILVDGIDIATKPRTWIRSRFGQVAQDTWLKSATVRENLLFARPDATEEELLAATKAAHAHSFIRRLPQGYDTVLGENGGSLSAGQKQLLCIARLMLALPPMLILDEATSSIDVRTEQKIQDAFQTMMQGRTSFIVAHRLSTIEGADCILYMEKGTIKEQGTHKELLEQKGAYRNLYESQFRRK